MGHSRAYPVLHTTDAVEAWSAALRLHPLLEWQDPELTLTAELSAVEEVRRLAEAFPRAEFTPGRPWRDPVTGNLRDDDPDIGAVGDAVLREALPWYFWHAAPLGAAPEQFVRAVDVSVAAVGLHGRWPDDPETGSLGHYACDGVEVLLNSRDRDSWEPAAHHTVLVHVTKEGDLDRAERLAARLGSTVLGEEQHGW